MKLTLTKEHIGKRVRKSHWNEDIANEVIYIRGDYVWLEEKTGCTTDLCTDDWEIVEPKKKPSERIMELTLKKVRPYSSTATGSDSDIQYIKAFLSAIQDFLDEEVEKKGEAGG